MFARTQSLLRKRRRRQSCKLPRYVRLRRSRTFKKPDYRRETMSTYTSDGIRAPFSDGIPTQGWLFLFGFLCFPCWWIGGYRLSKPQPVIVHPSVLANGHTATLFLSELEEDQLSISHLSVFFYRWNRYMAWVSLAYVLAIVGLFIWYFLIT
ncbi:hypothetical protein BY458DRAFT_517429 [Sporodiniella umbellata]|nr:hypothetical protein BY458DRAFT_517429 [Sporodiniella umbellata]